MHTTTLVWIALAVAIVLITTGSFIAGSRHQRTKRLQAKFGPEYQHIMNEWGDQRQAEHELVARLEHVEALDIRSLSEEEIKSFISDWRANQVEFVDEPLAVIQKADHLISQVLQTKGYLVEDFEQGAADVSVSYPDLVMDYRELHLIASAERDEIFGTEEMRKAMVRGRALFENLVKSHEPMRTPANIQKEHVYDDGNKRYSKSPGVG